MKKIIFVCLCLILVALSSFSVMAADMTITLKADEQTLKPGDKVIISIEVQTEKACTSFGMKMVYDKKIFEVVDGSCDIPGSFVSGFDTERGFVAMYLLGSKPKGEVGKVTLQVREDAPLGEATFTGKVSIKDGDTALQGTANTLTFQIATEEIQQTQPEETIPEEIQSEETEQTLPEISQPEETYQTLPEISQPEVQQTQPEVQQTQPEIQQTQPEEQTFATEQAQTTETVETQAQTQLTESTEGSTVLEGTMPTGIYTIGADTQDENDILLIAVIAVAVVAAVAVGGYLVLKKKNK